MIIVEKVKRCWHQAHPATWKIGFASFANTAMSPFVEYESDTVICAITSIRPRLCSVRRASWIDRHDDNVSTVRVTPIVFLWLPACNVINNVHAKSLTLRCCVRIVIPVTIFDDRFVRIVSHRCRRCEHQLCWQMNRANGHLCNLSLHFYRKQGMRLCKKQTHNVLQISGSKVNMTRKTKRTPWHKSIR